MRNDAKSTVAEWIESFSKRVQLPEELEHLVTIVDNEVLAEVPEYAADEELRRDLHASTRAHWRSFLSVINRERFEVHTPPEAYDLARTVARRGIDLAALLKTYRVAQRAVWTHITRTLDEEVADADLRAAVLVQFWERVSRWLDATVESLVGTYTEEREQWQRGALARRAETVHAVLRGDLFDLDTASQELGLSLRRHHTAMVLWADDTVPEVDVVRALEGSATELAKALGAPRPLTMASGARGLWCWAATAGVPDAAARVTATLWPGVRAAVGISAAGVGGFRSSHREALAAQSVAITAAQDRVITRYAEVELACLAAGVGGQAAMRAMVERELGPLAATDDATTRLRETLHEFLANAADAHRTGKALGVHRNTVRYRVRQAEQLRGHPIDRRRAHLELALHCHHVFGVNALADGDEAVPGQ
ncbi:PucR family transcriptional regulator [Saccharopolyspora halophila]|uniref:PucR family transcriptional regulator n=1 Tax=Saccharopolyspora halophila TaxID=405551 RepID=A0ABN3GWP7_9PSEU